MDVDRSFDDPAVAAAYDALNPWGRGDDFYLGLLREAGSVLDLACGTGTLLKRAAADGHEGVLVGVDVAGAMLRVARAQPRVAWIEADARTVDLGRRFELVTMTGHAFQVFLTDVDIRLLLANVARHLQPGGRFAFETRNPAARAWEGWREDYTVETIEPDLVRFDGTTLRFVDPEHLRTLVNDAGFRVEGWYGDWDGTPPSAASPEVVVVAALTPRG